MKGIKTAVRLVGAAQNAWRERYTFLVVFFFVFFFSFSSLLAFDLVPDSPALTTPSVTLTASPLSPSIADAFVHGEQPVKIEIPAIGMSVTVNNPNTTNIDILNEWLTKGAVRYPSSALLGENGNVIIFGHSSYLPIVHNLAYKAFDDIQKLKVGQEITVYSSDRAYVYTVDTVEKKDASSDAIPLNVTGSKLTLSTCDLFGTQKTDRFVVTATLVESHLLGA